MRYLPRLTPLVLTAAFGVTAVYASEPSSPLFAELVLPKAKGPSVLQKKPIPAPDDSVTWVKMEVTAVVKTDSGPAVLLKDEAKRYVLPIWIGPFEARAIQLALHELDTPRPLTHDTLTSIMRTLGGKMTELRIPKLENDIYYGELVLSTAHGHARHLDVRPSDGLALALRSHAPIYVKTSVLRRGAVPLAQD